MLSLPKKSSENHLKLDYWQGMIPWLPNAMSPSSFCCSGANGHANGARQMDRFPCKLEPKNNNNTQITTKHNNDQDNDNVTTTEKQPTNNQHQPHQPTNHHQTHSLYSQTRAGLTHHWCPKICSVTGDSCTASMPMGPSTSRHSRCTST